MLYNVLFSRHHPLSCYNHWMMEAEIQTCSDSKTERHAEVDDSDADYVCSDETEEYEGQALI